MRKVYWNRAFKSSELFRTSLLAVMPLPVTSWYCSRVFILSKATRGVSPLFQFCRRWSIICTYFTFMIKIGQFTCLHNILALEFIPNVSLKCKPLSFFLAHRGRARKRLTLQTSRTGNELLHERREETGTNYCTQSSLYFQYGGSMMTLGHFTAVLIICRV